MSPTTEFYCLAVALIIAIICGITRLSKFDTGSKIIWVLLIVDLITEISGHYTAVKYHTNMPVYNIYSLLEFFILCIYFNDIIDVFYKNNIGWHLAILGTIIGLINIIFFQNITIFNSNFLLFEGFVIIGLSLFGLFRLILKHDQLRLFRYHHFWFTSIILVYWSITFLNLGFYNFLTAKINQHTWILSMIIWLADLFSHIGIGIVFFMYPKLQEGNE